MCVWPADSRCVFYDTVLLEALIEKYLFKHAVKVSVLSSVAVIDKHELVDGRHAAELLLQVTVKNLSDIPVDVDDALILLQTRHIDDVVSDMIVDEVDVCLRVRTYAHPGDDVLHVEDIETTDIGYQRLQLA